MGTDVTLGEGQECGRQALLYLFAKVQRELGGLSCVASVDKLMGFVRSALDFIQESKGVDGASNFLVAIFGEDIGLYFHTETAVLQCPYGAVVQLEKTLCIRDA